MGGGAGVNQAIHTIGNAHCQQRFLKAEGKFRLNANSGTRLVGITGLSKYDSIYGHDLNNFCWPRYFPSRVYGTWDVRRRCTFKELKMPLYLTIHPLKMLFIAVISGTGQTSMTSRSTCVCCHAVCQTESEPDYDPQYQQPPPRLLEVSRHIWIQFKEQQCNYWRAPTSQISWLAHTQRQGWFGRRLFKERRESPLMNVPWDATGAALSSSWRPQEADTWNTHNAQGEMNTKPSLLWC